jgi:hypothetical protein
MQFVYINSGFSPNPDENIWDLFEVSPNFQTQLVQWLFVNSFFTPETLFITISWWKIQCVQNFGIDGKLVVNYACSMAWG